MMRELSEIAPISVVFAIAVWGLISFFITGPEMATRIAHADYVASCESSLIATVAANVREQERKIDQPTEAERQASATQDYYNRMEQKFPDHVRFMDLMSGGGFSQTVEVGNQVAAQVKTTRQQAKEAIRERAARAAEEAPNQCACQVQAALGESRTEWALFAATLTLVEQENVSNFPAVMRSNSRFCAERATS